MKAIWLNLPIASNAEELLSALFREDVPDFMGDYEPKARAFYGGHARDFVDALMRCAPGGFVDAVFGELAARKASIYSVAHDDG